MMETTCGPCQAGNHSHCYGAGCDCCGGGELLGGLLRLLSGLAVYAVPNKPAAPKG